MFGKYRSAFRNIERCLANVDRCLVNVD